MLNGPPRFSNTACKVWISWELVFMEVLTLVVESILVIRGGSFPMTFVLGLTQSECSLRAL